MVKLAIWQHTETVLISVGDDKENILLSTLMYFQIVSTYYYKFTQDWSVFMGFGVTGATLQVNGVANYQF